jgi:branched-chain amino acid transport system ATP-binding protein
MGLVDCQGSVLWKGQDINWAKRPTKIAHLGLGYVPESRDIFPKLTVHQNLLLGRRAIRQRQPLVV